MNLEQILTHFEGVKGSGGQYYARCSAHEDKHQSLSLAQGNDGKILLNCHAGCRVEDIVSSAGLEMMDLFPDTGTTGQSVTEAARASVEFAPKAITATYDYHDADGNLLAQKVRREDKSFLWRHRDSDGAWIYKKPPVTIPPYNLPAVLASDGGTGIVTAPGYTRSRR